MTTQGKQPLIQSMGGELFGLDYASSNNGQFSYKRIQVELELDTFYIFHIFAKNKCNMNSYALQLNTLVML